VATHVGDVELTAPSPLVVPADAARALVLVRWNGTPIGLAYVDCDDLQRAADGSRTISKDRLRTAIAAEVALPAEPPSPAPRAAAASIVVCTRERPHDLVRCLDALDVFAAAGHDVVVVDNAPLTPATADLVARHPFRYVCEPQAGLSNARNRGLREARHEIVAYTDDDAIPDSRWIDALVEPFADARTAATTGLVLPIELRTAAQHTFEAYAQHRRTFVRRVFTAADTPPATAGVVGIGANMAVRRGPALRLGGFDPRLGAGTRTWAGEENDMFARMLDGGESIVYTPHALVWHRHRDDEASLRQCVFGYGVGVYAFLTKRFVEHADLGALTVAARWLVGPFLRAAGRRLRGEPAAPFALLLREAAGAATGPVRFLGARHD
jgi:GT2 family glycosyltransferase